MALYTIERDARNAGFGMVPNLNALGCEIKAKYDSNPIRTFILAPVVITQGSDGAADTITFTASSKDGAPMPGQTSESVKKNANQPVFFLKSAQGMSEGDLLIAIAAFPCDYPIDRRVSLGIVSHPFLPKAATALDHHGLFDLCYLALSGAIQLSEKHQQNVWLELAAIDCQQAAFFNGDVWQCALMAIDKGLVKVNSSHEKQWVNWHQLARKQDTGPQP